MIICNMEDNETLPDFQLLTDMDDETMGFLEQLFTNEIEFEEVEIHAITQNGTKADADQPKNQGHHPADVDTNPKPRFKRVSDEELQCLKDCRQSESTKRNTKWAIKLFQDWSKEVLGEPVDFSTISPETLSDNLSKFYAEATPKFTDTREKQMSVAQAQEYHKNSFKSIRAGINRHLRDLDRDVDIVRDKVFRKSNDILDGKMKQNLQSGLSRPTKHKEIILESDLKKINLYLFSEESPARLRYRVWFHIAIHFVTRGIEFHQQLNLQSFVFKRDENGREYASLCHETRQKNWQGGLDTSEPSSDKRMYAYPGSEKCPVNDLKTLIAKTDQTASSLFNQCSKDAMKSQEHEIWFTAQPLKPYQFSRFMGDISRNSGCSKLYTAHCLRATAIQGLNDAGFELRHIMYMSGHKNESSVRSYNRSCSTLQKTSLSDALSSLSSGKSSVSSSESELQMASANPSSANVQTPMAMANTPSDSPKRVSFRDVPIAVSSSNFMSSGFISNSTFHNCVFQFGK